MREILFKAKRLDNGEWVEGYYCKWLKGERIITYSEKETDCIITWMSNGGMSRYEVDPETLCQFTGLHDKNGNKIWENDIVRKVDSNALGWHRERMCSISFDKLGYWLLTTEYGDGYWLGEFSSEQIEVIDNVFDNPELLKGE